MSTPQPKKSSFGRSLVWTLRIATIFLTTFIAAQIIYLIVEREHYEELDIFYGVARVASALLVGFVVGVALLFLFRSRKPLIWLNVFLFLVALIAFTVVKIQT